MPLGSCGLCLIFEILEFSRLGLGIRHSVVGIVNSCLPKFGLHILSYEGLSKPSNIRHTICPRGLRTLLNIGIC